ncbi:uncharacterized protein LOC112270886 isoform X2 [Brachypodium distachyon]|uniref:Uncharacterized protein n=2 Tax=Brachypodium distachyon TaxID=15368 RepID=A0A0Q3MPQ6_BRADI|nr:uncharacterized protein LOC112270886 isoform X2 [Brachypodium distachyon]KQK06214.1 hypothetical protein BRADI_2g25160v3 [Brachypodium distachyon]|eukprot:XP_024315202.1 uncharacterized protein LOC112270886 isoform X2 [Brachypodium distachyon]
MASPAALVAPMEVRCAGCDETLEVDHGTTDFACPGCATEQRLPPELMPRRPRRAIPITPAVSAHDRMPCGGCGTMLSVPRGLKSFACPICGAAGTRPQASALPVAQLVSMEPQVLRDPASLATLAGQVHVEVERYRMPTHSESQGWHPNQSVYKDEPFRFNSSRADKKIPTHSGNVNEVAYSHSDSVHVEDSHIDPLHEITTRPSKNKSRIQSFFLKQNRIQSSHAEKVHQGSSSQATPVLQTQSGCSAYSDHTNQSQERFPSDIITRHGKQKTTVAPRNIGKQLIEHLDQATHEQNARGTSSDGAHADQVHVEPDSSRWNEKRKRSKQSSGGNRKRAHLMNSSSEGIHLRRSSRLAKMPTAPIDAQPTQPLNSPPHENQSYNQDITGIIANMTSSSTPQQQVPQTSCNELDGVHANTQPSSSNHGALQPECITNRYSMSYDSWCEHDIPREGSCSADVLSVQLQTSERVTDGQQAHRLSSRENNLEQVDIELNRNSVATHGRHQRKGSVSTSNEAEQDGIPSTSGTRQHMTLAASCRRLAASMPAVNSSSAPGGALSSELEGDNPSLLPYGTSPVVPSQLNDASQPDVLSASVHPSSKKRKVRGQSSKRRKQHGPSELVEPCTQSDSHSKSPDPTQELAGPTELRHDVPDCATPRNEHQHDDADYGGDGGIETVTIEKRWCHSLPNVPSDEEEKPILTPVGDTMWLVHPLYKNARLPNGVIGCIVRERYPGMVKYKGSNQHAENWRHYAVAPDPLGEKQNLLERISADFWARYRWKDGFEAHAQLVVNNVIKKEVQQLIYSARIHAVLDYFKKFRGIKIVAQEARAKYLSQEEYMKVMPYWTQACPAAWESLARKWSSEIWKEKSMESRKRRNMNREPGHRQGSSSLLRLCQKKGEKEGRDVTPIEAYLYGHRNKDSSNPSNSCDDPALQRLEAYKEAVLEIHGPDYDWINSSIDSEAVYKVCRGKPHGRWLIFNGLVNSKEILADAKSQGLKTRPTQARQQGVSDVEERFSRLLEEKLQQVEESRQARDEEVKQQMKQELQEHVAAAIQSTNEYWLTCLQNYTRQTGANISLPPPFPILRPSSQPGTSASSSSAQGTPQDASGVSGSGSEPGAGDI